MKCFLDLDGVIADFVKGICKAHNKPWPYPENNGEYFLEKIWGITQNVFWSVCDYDFWFGLPKTEDADQIFNLACHHFGPNNVCFLTSPSLNKCCIDAKIDWIKKYYPSHSRLFSVSPAKSFCDSEDSYLIDDYEGNIHSFIKGRGILLPRPWNKNFRHDTLSYLQGALA